MAESDKDERFKTFIAILIALVSLVAAFGGARAGLVGTEDSELTRIGLINKARAARVELEYRLSAANQLVASRQYLEASSTATLTRADAVEARQEGLESTAVSLETAATAAQDSADVLAFRIVYTPYLGKDGRFDVDRMLDDLAQSPDAREYRSLRPQAYLDRGDARGEIGIRTMWALAVMSASLVCFGIAEMLSGHKKLRVALVVVGIAVVGASAWLMVKA